MIGPSDPAVSEALLQRLPLFVLPVVSHFPRIAMETYIRQRQLIMSPLITSHVIGENEPLTSILNKVIATKEVNHKGQGTRPRVPSGEGLWWGSGVVASELSPWTRALSLSVSDIKQTLLGTAHLNF